MNSLVTFSFTLMLVTLAAGCAPKPIKPDPIDQIIIDRQEQIKRGHHPWGA